MTIKELMNFAKEHNAEDYTIRIADEWGNYSTFDKRDICIKHETKSILIG